MEKLDKDLLPQNDIPSEAAVADKSLEDVAGGNFEEFRRYERRKEEKETQVMRETKGLITDY